MGLPCSRMQAKGNKKIVVCATYFYIVRTLRIIRIVTFMLPLKKTDYLPVIRLFFSHTPLHLQRYNSWNPLFEHDPLTGHKSGRSLGNQTDKRRYFGMSIPSSTTQVAIRRLNLCRLNCLRTSFCFLQSISVSLE